MRVEFVFYCILNMFVFNIGNVYGQANTTTTIKLDKSKGLPTNNVYGSIVDRYGYLWLATSKGVTGHTLLTWQR